MNDMRSDKKMDLICHCSGTTKEKIKQFINQGVDDLDSISRHTGACAGCGACETSIMEFLAEQSGIDREQAHTAD